MPQQGADPAPKRAYTTPRFEVFGDLRSVTLGGSTPGTKDSGNPLIKKPPMK